MNQEDKNKQIDAAWDQYEQEQKKAQKREFNDNFYKAESQRFGKKWTKAAFNLIGFGLKVANKQRKPLTIQRFLYYNSLTFKRWTNQKGLKMKNQSKAGFTKLNKTNDVWHKSMVAALSAAAKEFHSK